MKCFDASSVILLLLLQQSRLAVSRPQVQTCITTSTTVVAPTTTYTELSTAVITTKVTTPDDLGTFTNVVVVPITTNTLLTMTSTVTDCTANTTFTRGPTVTIYTSAAAASSLVSKGLATSVPAVGRRQANGCTVTITTTTSSGAAYTMIAANQTRTFTQYTAYTQETITSTTVKGTSYTIATAYTKTCIACGTTTTTVSSATTLTVTQDAKCAPSALVSAAGNTSGNSGYGLSLIDDTVNGGAAYRTSAQDASQCCQMCVEQAGCAGSGWDIRTKTCHLEFSANYASGNLDCGYAAMAYYDYGPDQPMSPGAGWYMAAVCGRIEYGAAQPDDET